MLIKALELTNKRSTSLRVVMGQRFCIPVVGQLVFVENGGDDDRISNYAFI